MFERKTLKETTGVYRSHRRYRKSNQKITHVTTVEHQKYRLSRSVDDVSRSINPHNSPALASSAVVVLMQRLQLEHPRETSHRMRRLLSGTVPALVDGPTLSAAVLESSENYVRTMKETVGLARREKKKLRDAADRRLRQVLVAADAFMSSGGSSSANEICFETLAERLV